jgi:hypothetical protein
MDNYRTGSASRRIVALAALALAALVVAALVGCSTSSPSTAISATAPVFSPPPATSRPGSDRLLAPVVARIPIPDHSDQSPFEGEFAVAGGAIWFETPLTNKLVRIDTTTNFISAIVQLDYPVELAVADDGSLWALGPAGGAPGPEFYTISRVDPVSGHSRAVARARNERYAPGMGGLWVPELGVVKRYDMRSGKVTKTVPIAVDEVQVACGIVWGIAYGDAADTLWRIDPSSGEATSYPGGGPPRGGRIYELADGCYRWTPEGLQPADSAAPGIDGLTSRPPSVQFDGRSFWQSPLVALQRYDPFAMHAVGPRWELDPRELNAPARVGIDSRVVAAHGSVWLIRADEVVRYDIPW